MIWFGCKKCGKRHGRAESLVGTMIFCDCGEGMRVPWSSTVPEPPMEEVEPVILPEVAPQPARPVPNVPPARPPEMRPPPPRADLSQPSRRGSEPRQPDPNYCLNHLDRDASQRCVDCECSFCGACVVTLEGNTLCAPCKNMRIRREQQGPKLAPTATLALVLSLLGGPLGFCLSMVGVSSQANGG